MARSKKNDTEVTKDEGVMMTHYEPEKEAAVALEELEKELDMKRAELERVKIELAEKRNEVEKTPLRHIDDTEKVAQSNSKERQSLREKIERQKAYDSELVTGKFMNRRVPGQSVKLTYMKYATDPVKWYQFHDGHVYTIPRGFVEQINEYYHTPRFIQKQGEMTPSQTVGENSQIAEVDTSNKKYAFVPVGF